MNVVSFNVENVTVGINGKKFVPTNMHHFPLSKITLFIAYIGDTHCCGSADVVGHWPFLEGLEHVIKHNKGGIIRWRYPESYYYPLSSIHVALRNLNAKYKEEFKATHTLLEKGESLFTLEIVDMTKFNTFVNGPKWL